MNKMAELMRRERAKGIDYGMLAMDYLFLIGADNVLKDYHEAKQLEQILREIEAECSRIWAEVVEDGNGKQLGADEAAERLVIYAERIRKERNMDNGSGI